jgi:broad specificity phosphatase PhoE
MPGSPRGYQGDEATRIALRQADKRVTPASSGVTDVTTIIIARHGETVWHAENRYAGISDVPLSGLGLQQAQGLAAWARDARLDAVYSSPLIRAVATARPVADAVRLELLQDSRLTEIDWGRGEGLTREEMADAFPAAFESFLEHPASSPLPGGESGNAALERALPALHDIVDRYPGGRALVVSHSTLTRLLVASVTGMDLDRYRSTMPHVGNCSLTVLEFGGDRPALLGFNLPTS